MKQREEENSYDYVESFVGKTWENIMNIELLKRFEVEVRP